MTRKNFKERIYEYINGELSKEERGKFERLINEDKELKRYYIKIKKFYDALKNIGEEKIPYSVENRVLSRIIRERKRKLSLSFGFALTALILILMFIPIQNSGINKNISIFPTSGNHKFIATNYVSLKHVKEIGITVYVKDEKIEEKSGRLRIPKNEFTSLYETLKDKGDVEINYIKGGEDEKEMITININYKNYPSLTGERLFGFYLPYVLTGILLIFPVFFFIKRKS